MNSAVAFHSVNFESLLTPKIATIFKHVTRVRMKRPKRPFSGFFGSSGNFEEAVVETERVANGVLPSLLILSIVRKEVHDKLVYFTESEHLAGTMLNGHGNQ